MDVLQSCGILQHVEDHCTHCGCLWSSQDDSEFCLRCRSHFFFSIPPSLSPSPKRVRLTNQRQLTYCWCETCETFHWLAYSFPPSFISILSLSTLPIISSAMSSPAITTSRRSARVRFIPSDRRNDRSATAGRLVCFVPRGRHTAHSLRGRCVLCLKRSLDSLDPPNRTAVGKRVTDRNRGNESRIALAGVSSSGLFGLRR